MTLCPLFSAGKPLEGAPVPELNKYPDGAREFWKAGHKE